MENCPTCGLKCAATCRCLLSHRYCPKGHHWHRCPMHGFVIASAKDFDVHGGHTTGKLECTCANGKAFHFRLEKYHPVQPRTSGGSWTLPSGENHPLNGGEITISESEHYADVGFKTTKYLDLGAGIEPLAITETVATASGFKSANDATLVLVGLNVMPTHQKRGIGSAMLAELGGAAIKATWKYSTTNFLADDAAKFVKGLTRRGMASERADLKGAYWLDAGKLAEKYKRS